MAQKAIGLPKKRLVEIILANLPEALIRERLNIGERTTNLRKRLESFTKHYLVAFFEKHRGKAGDRILREYQDAYPIRQAPTFYLVQLIEPPRVAELRKSLRELEQLERKGKMFFGKDKAVRTVYVSSRARTVLEQPLVYEFELTYEKRLTYTCPSPKPCFAWGSVEL